MPIEYVLVLFLGTYDSSRIKHFQVPFLQVSSKGSKLYSVLESGKDSRKR